MITIQEVIRRKSFHMQCTSEANGHSLCQEIYPPLWNSIVLTDDGVENIPSRT